MKSLKESQSFDIVSGKEFGRETAVHALDTYQEDNAFMRKMEKIRFEDMNRQELQNLDRLGDIFYSQNEEHTMSVTAMTKEDLKTLLGDIDEEE